VIDGQPAVDRGYDTAEFDGAAFAIDIEFERDRTVRREILVARDDKTRWRLRKIKRGQQIAGRALWPRRMRVASDLILPRHQSAAGIERCRMSEIMAPRRPRSRR